MKIEIKIMRMPGWEQIGMQAAGEVVGAGMGLMLEKHNDKRQLRQQGKLQELQIKGQKEMTDYNYGKEMEKWEATGYGAQKRQMMEAGLNPALLYGMGSGGGQSSAVAGGNVGGGQAQQGSQETTARAGMGIEAAMAASTMKLQDSQAKLNEVEANKRAGVDTELGKTQIADLTQGITNKQAQQALTEAQTRMQNIENEVAGDTMYEAMDEIRYSARNMRQIYEKAVRENWIADKTKGNQIGIIQQQELQAIANVALTKAQEKGVIQKTEESKAQMQKWIEEIRDMWKARVMEGRKVNVMEDSKEIQKLMQEQDKDFKGGIIDNQDKQTIINAVGQAVNAASPNKPR